MATTRMIDLAARPPIAQASHAATTQPPVAQPDRGAPVKPASSAGSNPAGGTRHVVEVNECRVFFTASGEWWTRFVLVQHPSRLAYAKITIGGAVVHVACNDREHADWLAHHFVEHGGLPRSAVKVRLIATHPGCETCGEPPGWPCRCEEKR